MFQAFITVARRVYPVTGPSEYRFHELSMENIVVSDNY